MLTTSVAANGHLVSASMRKTEAEVIRGKVICAVYSFLEVEDLFYKNWFVLCTFSWHLLNITNLLKKIIVFKIPNLLLAFTESEYCRCGNRTKKKKTHKKKLVFSAHAL